MELDAWVSGKTASHQVYFALNMLIALFIESETFGRNAEDAPFAIGYTFEDKPHHYLPDAVGMISNGRPFIAEAGMEDDKRGDRNLAKAEAARRLAHLQQGTFWIGTECTLTKRHHYNLVFLHARRKIFPAFAPIAAVVAEVWPWGEMTEVAEVARRLSHQFPVDLASSRIAQRGSSGPMQSMSLSRAGQTCSRSVYLHILSSMENKVR